MAMASLDREEVLKNSELAGIGFGAWREMQQQGQRRCAQRRPHFDPGPEGSLLLAQRKP